MEQYEWDEANRTNLAKHGFGFELIEQFDWQKAVYRTDDRQQYGEFRRLAYGFIGPRAFAVVFVVRGRRIRIISLRPMHLKEMKKYGLQTPS
ncbi:MAG TPA: BrnT family toxin [Devosia sp.]